MYNCKNEGGGHGVISNEERQNFQINYTFSTTKTKEFFLDKETINLVDYFQYIDSEKLLSFINNYNNSIYFYDDKTQKFSHRIQFDKAENKDRIGYINGYLYSDSNNIFIYSYYQKTLFETNSKSEIINTYLMSSDSKSSKNMIFPVPYTQTLAPLKKYKNKILSVGFVTGETSLETYHNRVVCTILDLEDKSLVNVINYPDMYTLFNWAGGFTYRMPSYDLVDEAIIVNFPASHYLIKYSLVTGEKSCHYAGSASIESIKSFPHPKDDTIDETLAWDWYMNNASYEGVLYDKYKMQYYRIARLPLFNYNKNERGNRKPVVIIILDENLSYKGEVELPSNIHYFTNNCFVTEDGFNIQALADDEDKLFFYQYNFIKNED